MREQLAGLLVRGRHLFASARAILAGVALALAGGTFVFAAPADVARGLAWLQAQVQTDGNLANQSSAGAQHQARCETAATLIKLAGNSAQVASLVTALQDSGGTTETLACRQHLRQQLGQVVAGNELEARRFPQQGYAAYEGYGADSSLDSGWALAAQLKNLDSQDKTNLLIWLQSRQGAEGSFSTNGRTDLLATAAVLRGLKEEASKNSTAAAIASKAADWLIANRNAQGNWMGDVAVTAIVFEAVHPYTGAEAAIASNVESWLLAQQNSDGSWQGDAHATAVALRALALTTVPALDPTRAVLKVKFVDARTGQAVPRVQLNSVMPTISAQSDLAGTVTLTNIEPANYEFAATLSGYATTKLSVALSAGEWLDLGSVQLIAPSNTNIGVVAGTVRDQATGQGIAGAVVSIEGQGLSAITAEDGSYLIPSVAPGSVTVSASSAGHLAAAHTSQLQSGQVMIFSPWLTLDPGNFGAADCRILGTVLDAATQRPIAGVTINVSGAATATVVSDANGRYSTPGLASGLITLSSVKPGYDAVSATTQLLCSQSRATAVQFSPRLYPSNQTPPDGNTSGLKGAVIDAATNQPIAGAQLRVVPSFGVAKTAISAPDGAFGFTGLNGDAVQLVVQASGYEGVTLTYALTPLQEFDIGQVRVRRPKVQQLMPDLAVESVLRGTARTDAQTLQLNGALQVNVSNAGTQEVPAKAGLIAFSDADRDGKFDPAVDRVLGRSTLDASLVPGERVRLQIDVAGTLPFRDAPIAVIADPDGNLADINRANNVKSTADSAQIQPNIGTFKPVLKWHWSGAGAQHSSYNQVMMAPVAGPLLDTNRDGRVDHADVPVVVFTSFSATVYGSYNREGVIRAVHGGTGAELLTIKDSTAAVGGVGNLALADLDADGKPEIIAIKLDGGLVVFRNSGAKWWTTAPLYPYNNWYGVSSSWGAPLIADLEGDGAPEVILGKYVYSFDGRLKWAASTSFSGGGAARPMAIAADLDLNGTQELIVGPSAHASGGGVLWSNSKVADGFTAVGNFNDDPYPEIVISGGAKVSLLDRNGALLWQVSTPGFEFGGPPTVADMDGDGLPEIGVANATRYTVFRADGSVLWSVPAQDASSYMTGSTVFDFDGDGSAEVLYGDEISIRAFKGANGTAIWNIPNSSGTTHEYPIVADVDRDGHADLVTIANDYGYIPNQTIRAHGIRVYRDENNSWVNVRTVWNQHAYSITNVNDDLTIPAKPLPSWEAHNTFRANKRLEGSPLAVADATVSYARVEDGGALGSRLTVRVGNGGSLAIPSGTKIAFYIGQVGGSRLGVASTSKALAAGEYEDVQLSVTSSLASVPTVSIVVDDDGTGKSAISDFDRSNNNMTADLSSISTSLVVAVSTDKPLYTEADQAIFNAPIKNEGSFARDAVVRFTVLDANGEIVEVLPLGATVSVPASGTASSTALWPVAGIVSGNYAVKAELISPAGLIYGTASADFTVASSQVQAANARISADRVSYSAAQAVQLTSRVANATVNSALDNVQAKTEVKSAAGQSVFVRSEPIAQLAAGGSRQYGYSLPASGLATGTYSASVQLLAADGAVLAQNTTNFSVLGAEQTGVGLTGQLQFNPGSIYVGQIGRLALQVTNTSTSSLSQVPLTVRIIDPLSGAVVATFNTTLDTWAAGQTSTLEFDWNALGSEGQILVAAATAQVAGKEVPVGQANIKILGIPYSGSLSADPVEVEAGTNVALNYTVANPAPVAGHMVGSLSVQTQAAQTLATWPLSLDIGAQASFAGNQLYTTGEELQTLTAVLSQHQGDTSRVLATTAFTVIDPPVPVDLAVKVKAPARILVLVSCPPGLGTKEDAACVAQRTASIQSYLQALGYSAKTVATGEAFAAEMRCGSYNTYWISNGAIKLDAQTIGELKAAVRRGEALWMDGVHDSRNQLLHDAAGVKELGKLPIANQIAGLSEAGLYGSQTLPTLGQPTTFEATTGQVQGLFTQGSGQQVPIPAVVSNDWGQGKSLLFAFDLGGMITADAAQASSQLAGFVATSAAHATSGAPTLTVGDLTELQARIVNQSTRTVDFKAEATLPVGLASIATTPQAQLSANTDGSVQARWNFTLAAGASQPLKWLVRAEQTGNFSVPLSVYSLPKAGSTRAPKLRASSSFALEVKDAPALLLDALTQVHTLQPSASSDKNAYNKAIEAVNQASSLHSQQQYEQAIVQWLAAADWLASIGSVDTSAAKHAIALALEATTDALCIQRCGAAVCQ